MKTIFGPILLHVHDSASLVLPVGRATNTASGFPMNARHKFFFLSPKFILLLALFFTATMSPACAGRNPGLEKKELFLRYQKAIEEQDFETLRSVLSSDAIDEIEKSGVDLETAVEMMQSMTPPQVSIKKPLPSEEEEDLLLEGVGEGFEHSEGRVIYVREDGKWKIAKIGWKIKLDLSQGYTGLDGIASSWDPNYKCNLGFWSNAPKFKKIDDKYLKASSNIFRPPPSPFLKGKGYVPQPVQILPLDGGPIDRMTFTIDGSYLLLADYGDFVVRLWNATSWMQLSDFKMNDRPTSIAASPLGDLFVTGDTYGFLNFWPIQGSQIDKPLRKQTNTGGRLAVAISDNAKLVATVSGENFLSIWSLETKEQLTKVKTPLSFSCVDFSPAGPILGVDPLSWTSDPLGRRNPRWERNERRIHWNIVAGFSSWFVPVALRSLWLGSLNLRHRRFATGRSRPIAMTAVAATG